VEVDDSMYQLQLQCLYTSVEVILKRFLLAQVN